METQTYSRCKYCNEPIGKHEARCRYCASLIDWEEAHSEHSHSKDSINNEAEELKYQTESQRNELVRGQDFVLVDYTPPVAEDKLNNQINNINQIHNTKHNINTTTNNSFTKNKAFVKKKKPLSNSAKVWIATLCTVFPFVGQIAGLILSISFINSSDPDKRTYGSALLIPNVILFVLNMFMFFAAIGLLLSS